MTRLTAAVFLLLCCLYSWRTGCLALSSESNCLYSRLDFFSCIPHADTSWPGPNEYALYRTFIQNRIQECRYRDPNRNRFNEIIRPIDNLGNPNVRLLYSPGYLRNQRYANNMLVSYNVQCPEGRLPYLVFNELELRNKECFNRCEDYVNVTCAACGTSESCGTQPTNNYYNLEQEHFSVTFRTSRLQRENGFELSVICFDPMSLNKAGCSNFGGKKKRDLEIYRNMWQKRAERFRRLVADPEFVGPQPFPFPDFPTLSTFRTFPTIPTLPPLRVERVDVALRDTVSYRGSTITVSRGGRVIRRIRNIARLVTRDASGGDHTFNRNAVELRPGGARETIQLRGPGEILVSSSTATFLRDSQPIALSANEKRVLTDLTNELFNLIPSSNDIDVPEEDGVIELEPIKDLPRTPGIPIPLPRARRAAAIAPFVSLPRKSVRTAAIRESILFERSCNPVVSTASASTLSIAKRQNPFMVESVRKTIDLEGLLPLS